MLRHKHAVAILVTMTGCQFGENFISHLLAGQVVPRKRTLAVTMDGSLFVTNTNATGVIDFWTPGASGGATLKQSVVSTQGLIVSTTPDRTPSTDGGVIWSLSDRGILQLWKATGFPVHTGRRDPMDTTNSDRVYCDAAEDPATGRIWVTKRERMGQMYVTGLSYYDPATEYWSPRVSVAGYQNSDLLANECASVSIDAATNEITVLFNGGARAILMSKSPQDVYSPDASTPIPPWHVATLPAYNFGGTGHPGVFVDHVSDGGETAIALSARRDPTTGQTLGGGLLMVDTASGAPVEGKSFIPFHEATSVAWQIPSSANGYASWVWVGGRKDASTSRANVAVGRQDVVY